MRMLRTTLAAGAFLLAAPAFPATIIAGKAETPKGRAVERTVAAGPGAELPGGLNPALIAWGSFAGLVLAGTMLRKRRPASVIA